jgi:hypothetical protein
VRKRVRLKPRHTPARLVEGLDGVWRVLQDDTDAERVFRLEVPSVRLLKRMRRSLRRQGYAGDCLRKAAELLLRIGRK